MKQTSLHFLLLLVLAVAGCSREPKTVDELRAAGDKAYFAQKYPEARAYYLKAIAQKPSDKHLLYFVGMAYRQDAMWDSALFYFKRADLLYPDDRELNLELHDAARETKNWKYAIQSIRTLIKLGEPEPQYWVELAELYSRDTEPSATYYWLRKIVTAGTDDPQYYMRLVNVSLALDSPAVAQNILDSAITKFGERPEFLANKAYICAYRRDYDQAESLFREAIAADSMQIGFKLGLANVLSFSDEKPKLRESLALYREVKDKAGDQFAVDSIIGVLEQQVR